MTLGTHTAEQQAEWDRLLIVQRELECTAYSEGAARFRERLAQATNPKAGTSPQATSIGGAKTLLKRGLDRMEAAVDTLIHMKVGHQAGARHSAVKWCKKVGPDVTAYLVLKTVLDSIHLRTNIRDAARRISGLMLDELRYRRFQEEVPHVFEYKLKSFHTSSYTHMARSMAASMGKANVNLDDLQMSDTQRIVVGSKLIDLLMEATGLIQVEEELGINARGKRRKKNILLVATPDTLEWIAKHNDALALQQPLVFPMVVPPLDWAPNSPGGFRFALREKFSIVRKVKDAGYMHGSGPVVYNTLNRLQQTAWKINAPIYHTITKIIEAGGLLGGLPRSEDESMPTRPLDIATNPDSRKQWRREAHRAKNRNHARRQQALALSRVRSAAQRVVGEAAIYFPYSLDFRGRLYPIATYLTPQGDDVSRGLLTFADGKPLDEAGIRWLAIHGANCLGKSPQGIKFSQQTLDDRVQWIVTNSKLILDAAANPLTSTWWHDAEKPFQFLAFCCEWAGLIQARSEGSMFISTLPCAMDGSCNGLQHFSALLCDDYAGAAVNITPQDQPQDIYQRIADRTLDVVQARSVAGDKLGLLWMGLHSQLGIIDRKLTKRPTMTFGYGSKQYGFKAQLLDYLKDHDFSPEIRGAFTETRGDGIVVPLIGAAAGMMGDTIWNALGVVVVSAFGGMDWMQRAVKGISNQNKPVTWTVPLTGFCVTQNYYAVKRGRIRTILAGQMRRLSSYKTTEKVNHRKQSNAVAPNIIHSLDAAALMLTVDLAAAHGIDQFSMIHDSYGTLASDCTLLAQCCRQAFARLYSEVDVMEHLHQGLRAQWEKPELCPVPPPKGSLDVSQVVGSTYFFA